MYSKRSGYIVKNGTIILQKELTKLDLFVKKFLGTLIKYSDYLIVSGYVSICCGRTRGTEYIDIIVPVMGRDRFKNLFNDLERNNFWCYQGDTPDSVYITLKSTNAL